MAELFQLCLMVAGKAGAYLSEATLRLVWKTMAWTNTQAYNENLRITNKKFYNVGPML